MNCIRTNCLRYKSTCETQSLEISKLTLLQKRRKTMVCWHPVRQHVHHNQLALKNYTQQVHKNMDKNKCGIFMEGDIEFYCLTH